MKVLQFLLIPIYFISSFYLVSGGLIRLDHEEKMDTLETNRVALESKEINREYDHAIFKNQYLFDLYIVSNDVPQIFRWVIDLDDFSALLITAVAFGLLGTLINLLKSTLLDNKPHPAFYWVLLPLLGSLVGILVLGAANLVPSLISTNAGQVRPISIVFLCLFSGVYVQSFFEKLENAYNTQS